MTSLPSSLSLSVAAPAALLIVQKGSKSPSRPSGLHLGGTLSPEWGVAVPEQVAEPMRGRLGLLEEHVGLGIGVWGDRAMLTAAAAAHQLSRQGQGQRGAPGTLCAGQPGMGTVSPRQPLGPRDAPRGLSPRCSNWGCKRSPRDPGEMEVLLQQVRDGPETPHF